MGKSLERKPTREEIIQLAFQEGHDADIPSNIGSIKDFEKDNINEKLANLEFDKDVEKGTPDRSESVSSGEEVEDRDPNIVDWDGPDDPQNPMNWPFNKKWGSVLLVSAITFLTPLASSMFAPGVPKVMETFNSTNDMLEGFMVSVYVLGFAFGPLSMFGSILQRP